MADSTASDQDTLAATRALPTPEVASIPETPDNFQPTSIEVRRKSLLPLDETLYAESDNALSEYAARGSKVITELGPSAPSPEEAARLLKESQRIRRAKARAKSLLRFLEEKEDILNNDVSRYLKASGKELRHFLASNDKLKEIYQHLYIFTESNSNSIREGIVRAKKNKK